MRKGKIAVMTVLICSYIFMSASFVMAADNATVTLTKDSKIEYTSYEKQENGNVYLGNAFENMAPGDTREQTIQIVNKNKNDATFYLSQKTLQALEKINSASGGAYKLELKVGKTSKDAVSMMDAIAGGYGQNDKASTTGLSDVTELKDYTYLADLKSGDKTNLYLSLQLDGEGMDHTASVDYTSSMAKLGFDFRAYFKDAAQVTTVVVPVKKDNVVTNIIDQVVPLAKLTFAIAVISGGIVVVMFKKRRKAADQS
jgi:hypothetical protein